MLEKFGGYFRRIISFVYGVEHPVNWDVSSIVDTSTSSSGGGCGASPNNCLLDAGQAD